MSALLRLSHVRKSFGAQRALQDAGLELHAGQVTALIGENGAGKSTLVKIIAGYQQPDGGELELEGRSIRIASPQAARELGISVVHQESVVFDNLSVAENICIAARPQRGALVDWRTMRARAAQLLEQLDARFDPDMPAGHLSVAQKHIVQIARALSSDARVLVLDEPTASLSHREVADLFRIITQLRAAGRAIAFISHRFEEIFAIADRYAVFRDGVSVGQGLIGEATRESLIQLMVGRDVEVTPRDSAGATVGAELLRVTDLGRAQEFSDVSFAVHRGEILGIYGLVGAGRTELVQCLFGLQRPDSGSLYVDGQRVQLRDAAAAMALGIAYVPEDRQRQGVVLPFSIASNIALPNQLRLAPAGVASARREAHLAQHWIDALDVRTRGPAQAVQDLSGGNQQKVVLGKWLAREPRLLILDEPTKGIDVAAKAAVHRVTSEFAARGNAVIMVSSELPEILALADRVLVMRRGRVRALLDRAAATPQAVLRAATDA